MPSLANFTVAGRPASAVLSMPVLGKGQIDVGSSGTLELQSLVGPDLTVNVGNGVGTSVLTIDHPHEYFADTSFGFLAEIDLVGLAHADSYSFKNDMLAIYSGNSVIDT